MANARWLFLWLALAAGLGMFVIPLTPTIRDAIPQNASDYVLGAIWITAAVLQVLGALGMRTHLRAKSIRAPVAIGMSFGAAIAWTIAFLTAGMGVAAGAGGLPIFFLLTGPSALIAIILQIVALILFGGAERKANAAGASAP